MIMKDEKINTLYNILKAFIESEDDKEYAGLTSKFSLACGYIIVENFCKAREILEEVSNFMMFSGHLKGRVTELLFHIFLIRFLGWSVSLDKEKLKRVYAFLNSGPKGDGKFFLFSDFDYITSFRFSSEGLE